MAFAFFDPALRADRIMRAPERQEELSGVFG
jgi:hypothetical protein